jgi:hypothetical protein
MIPRVLLLFALGVTALVTRAAAADKYLDFPFVDVKPTIKDSGIVVERGKKAYWVDNDTLVFSTPTSETWEHWQPVRQVPVIRITAWNTKTGEVQRFGEVHHNDLCAFNGRILYRTYRMEGSTRVREKGTYRIDAWWGGPWNAATYLGDDASADLQQNGFNEIDCSPRSRIPPIPKWLAAKGWWHNHLSNEFGVKIDGTRGARGPLQPALLCRYESESERDCNALQLSSRHGYSFRYVPHLSSFILTTPGNPGEPQLILGVLDEHATDQTYGITDIYRKRGTPRTPLVTRVGGLYVNEAFANRMNDLDVGIWQIRGQSVVRIARVFIQQLGTGQASIAPDGCKLAVTGNKHGGDARATLMAVSFC